MLSKVFKELLKLNSKRTNDLSFKSVQGPNEHLTEQDLQKANKHRDAPRCAPLGKCGLNEQTAAARLSQWPRQHQHCEGVNTRNAPSLLEGVQNGTATVEAGLRFHAKPNTLGAGDLAQ